MAQQTALFISTTELNVVILTLRCHNSIYMKEHGFSDWLKQNFFTLLVTVAGMAMAYGILNARVMAMEIKIAEYPSQDWFQLKFDTIEKRFNTIEVKIDDSIGIIDSL